MNEGFDPAITESQSHLQQDEKDECAEGCVDQIGREAFVSERVGKQADYSHAEDQIDQKALS